MYCVVLLCQLIVAAILAYASRYCQLKLLAVAGLKSTNEYCDYILNDERSDLDESDVADRMSWKELKSHIQVLKSPKRETSPLNALDKIPLKLSMGSKMLWQSGRYLLSPQKNAAVFSFDDTTNQNIHADEIEAPNDNNETIFTQKRKLYSSVDSAGLFSRVRNAKKNVVNANNSQHRPSIINASSFEIDKVEERPIENNSDKAINPLTHFDLHNRKSNKLTQLVTNERKLDVFLFNSPTLYYYFRGCTNLMFCLLLAFYTTTFSSLSLKTQNPIGWNCVIIALLLSCAFCQAYTIRSSSFIYAFSKLDANVTGRVIEENEEKMELARRLRRKLATKLQNAVGAKYKDTKLAILQLFREIKSLDGDSEGYITKSELRLLLQKLNIHFSQRRFDEAFQLFDANVNGRIELTELYDFIFPESANQV